MCGMGIFLSNNIMFSGWRTKEKKRKREKDSKRKKNTKRKRKEEEMVIKALFFVFALGFGVEFVVLF